jgi:hypothetical protein
MIKIDRKISSKGEMIFSFDLEWTKNYRIKNGNQPFCFSLVYFPAKTDLSNVEAGLEFGFCLRYVENRQEQDCLIQEAEEAISGVRGKSGLFVGHQLSSDISVLLRQGGLSFAGIHSLQDAWRQRKSGSKFGGLSVFDTRYDLDSMLKRKSRRLVDVCQELRLDVSQPEIDSSMTKMQNDFYSLGDKAIMERLSVLNIRHSLSAALLSDFFLTGTRPSKKINVNRVLQRNLAGRFEYLLDKTFLDLI